MPPKLTVQRYSETDHAKTYKPVAPAANRDTPEIEGDYQRVMEEGYVIIENILSPERCAEIKAGALPHLDHQGRNSFEGHKTQRVYDVLSKTRLTDELAVHPRILGIMDKIFCPNYLLSQSQIINILPGETAQALHYDDGFYRIPRPRPPLGAATIWAIDDFTKENGATQIIPKSHLWDGSRGPKREDTIAAVMPAGSVLFFIGTSWHGGGDNRSSAPRMAVTHQYCDSYMRQQENYSLALSKDTVRALSPELRSLVGYSIHPPFMGMVNGKHPLRLLEEQ
jgi:ectoine hydroxylase-related dioxygenase (phytanoyl-CoA dioxygenase family)